MSERQVPPIRFEDVWKKFRLGERHDSLRDLIPGTLKRLTGRQDADNPEVLTAREFWAVKGVSFSVDRGEALGIIGPNGAGKSTTLKLLTRILRPTRGRAEVRGRVGALIEVASGFHPDLTGRENVFLQGAIMGMRRREIQAKFDQIVEFAGVGEFIETQVKRYSSGMNARLGFAIAAHLDPDAMIIDEVLSVGDAAFQDKCVKHMRGMIDRGTPVVFVSHNLPAVLELCTRVIVINRGTVAFDGKSAAAIQYYRNASLGSQGTSGAVGGVRIASVKILENGEPFDGVVSSYGSVAIRIAYVADEPVARPRIAVDIHRGDGLYCYGTTTYDDDVEETVAGEQVIELRLPKLALLPGAYVMSVGLHRPKGGAPYDVHQSTYPLSVESDCRDRGVVAMEAEWARVSL